MESPFHLSRLPAKSLAVALKCMGIIEITAFSFCSSATKKSVKSLNLSYTYVTVTFGKTLSIHFDIDYTAAQLVLSREANPASVVLCTEYYYDDEEDEPTYERLDITPKVLKFTARDYLLHLMDVLNQTKVCVWDRTRNTSFNVKEIKNLLDGIPIVRMSCDQYRKPNDVLRYGSAHTEKLWITMRLSNWSFHQISYQQFQKLDIRTSILNLNELLNLDSHIIWLGSSIFGGKELNLFIKHWMIGLTSQNVRYIFTFLSNGITAEKALWNGIEYQKQPESTKRTFKYNDPGYTGYPQEEIVHGGYDIQSVNGARATVKIFKRNYLNIKFMVWND